MVKTPGWRNNDMFFGKKDEDRRKRKGIIEPGVKDWRDPFEQGDVVEHIVDSVDRKRKDLNDSYD